MVVDGKSFTEGETIAVFDKIQISGLQELRSYVAARGGYGNRAHVFWETTKAMSFTFSQGVFSPLQFGLMSNNKVFTIAQDEPLLITYTEKVETGEDGVVYTKYAPVDEIFIYNDETGEKIRWWWYLGKLQTSARYTTVIIRYRYNYLNGAKVLKIGPQFINGFLALEGRTRVKDDTSGLITTGIIKIPKLKLMSGLSIRLGNQANPVVGNFNAEGVPVDERGSSYVCELQFLNNDIDSDM